MVKGISRQVILVHSPDTKLFEQAIFILKENAGTVTDEMLLQEAKGIINISKRKRMHCALWVCSGAIFTGAIWLFTIIL